MARGDLTMPKPKLRPERAKITFDAATGEPTRAPLKIRLSTIGDVRKEMATIYRLARNGDMDTSDTGRLAYILTGIGKLIEVELIEARIETLERKLLK